MTNLQDQDVASTYKCDNSPGKSIPETQWGTCFYSNVMAMTSPTTYHIYFIIPDFFSELLEQHRLRKATGSGGLQVPDSRQLNGSVMIERQTVIFSFCWVYCMYVSITQRIGQIYIAQHFSH